MLSFYSALTMSVQSTYKFSIEEAFERRHSTRNFKDTPFSEEKMSIIRKAAERANKIAQERNYEVELVVAPPGFGRMNMLVNEKG
ncbi:FMN-dependent nitroreductase-like family [Trichomonas vaginalis G3]|nr:FMN-dependent nitroreductase-like family [Trichomonas vaginalis G3]KAI5549277.1 FMN-dependent nitroreductase-like family [Trichomonas vaginalis G3]